MKEIKFRPLRLVKKTGNIVVASYEQWRKVKVADYSEFKLLVNTEYRHFDKNSIVHNHKGEPLFWENYNPNSIELINEYDLVDGERPAYPEKWITDYGMYCAKGLDCGGVPTFSHKTSMHVSNYEDISKFEPLTVEVVRWWFGWFLYQLNNNELIFQ